MADLERFKFTLPGYTPDEMPLDRLIEYLNQLSIILGQPGDLHLIGIEKSSTRPVLAMRHDVAFKARARARQVAEGGGSARRREAFDTIRRMVAQDGGKPAVLKSGNAQILKFPSADIGLDQVIQSVRQQTSIEGTLVRVGGIGENAQLLIQEMSGNVIAGCTASRSVAQAMAPLIYHAIRVSGIGSWHRTEEGRWAITRLHVQSFDPLDESELEDVVARLRSLNVKWPADTIEQLQAMREQAA
ncbi:MAG: hypothetical protein JWO81_1193 [Alphaproteobacteria bacterium]|nr:hypothetical protein [Alphaproteobacteria bacterium]